MYPVTKTTADNFKTNALQYLSILVNPVTGSSFEITSADVLAGGLEINRYSANGDSIALGSCVAAELNLRLENGDGRFDSIVFEGAQLVVSVGTPDGDNIAWIPLGYFTVDNAPRRLAVITITALDGMVQFDKEVNMSALNLPTTVKNLVTACCNECNIILETDLDTLPNKDYSVTSVGEQENLTYRSILAWCCQIMGVCGFMDWQGHLELSWYKKDGIPESISGEIASFVSYTEIPITTLNVPVTQYQNLNGYDHPWAGGCGVNLMPVPVVGLSISTASRTAGQITGSPAEDSSNGAEEAYIPVDLVNNEYVLGYDTSVFATNIPNSMIYGYGADKSYIERLAGSATNPKPIRASQWTDASLIKYIRVRIYSNNGRFLQSEVDVANFQLVKGTELPATWSPYENICPIYPANGKNLLPYPYSSGTTLSTNGIDFTANADGSLKVKGTASANADFYFVGAYGEYVDAHIPSGSYILSMSRKGGTVTTNARIYPIENGGSTVYATENTPLNVTIDSTNTYRIFMRIMSGAVMDATYYPMVRPAEIASPVYVPYKGFEVTRTGKNLIDLANIQGSGGSVSAQITLPQGTYYTYQFTRNMSHNMYWQYLLDGNAITMTTTGDEYAKIDYSSGSYNRGKNKITLYQKCTVRLTVGQNSNTASYPVDVMLTMDATGYSDFPTTGDTSVYKASMYEPYQGTQFFNLDYNMWDEQWEVGGINDSTGENQADSNRIRSKNYIPCSPSTAYYYSSPASASIFFYSSSHGFISKVTMASGSLTTPANAYYMRFYEATAYGTTYNNDITFNYSNPSQVGYGGTLEVETGVLTVTYLAVDLGSLTWTYDSSNLRFYAPMTGVWTGWSTRRVPCFSSAYKTLTNGEAFADVKNGDAYLGPLNSQWCVFVHDERYTDATTFKSAVTGVTFVYLANASRTYQLTPTQVTALLGQNNIWTDSQGTINVTFPAITTITPADRYNSDIYENPVTITGVQVKGKENQALYGTDDYALNIEGNDLIQDEDCETIANGLSSLVGFSYHPFSASVLPMPYLYPLDMVAVEYKGEWYDCALTEVNFVATSPTSLKGTGESAQTKSYAQINPLTNRERAIIESVKTEVNTTLNKAINNLTDFNQIISNALGLYHTNVSDGQGGFIRYLHNAPDLESSTYIVTETAQGFAWTNNGWNGGSPVWSYGVTSGGYALFKWLSAEGIDVTKASSDYRAEVTPEHFNIYYQNELIITIDATDRGVETPRLTVPYNANSDNKLKVGKLVWIPTATGVNAVFVED